MFRINPKVLTAAVLIAFGQFTAFAQTPSSTLSPMQLETEGMKLLTGERLSQLLTNNTLYFRPAGLPPNTVQVYSVLYSSSGVRYVDLPGGVQIKATWYLENDRLCEEDFTVAEKKVICRSLYLSERIGATCEEGEANCRFRYRWTEGNPGRLGQ